MQRYKVFSGIDLLSTAGTETIWRGGIDMNIAFEVDAAIAAKDAEIEQLRLSLQASAFIQERAKVERLEAELYLTRQDADILRERNRELRAAIAAEKGAE